MDKIVLIIIGLTCVTSVIGFSNQHLFDRGKFNVGAILQGKQWDRMLSSGFLHGDFMHLLFNMITLYFFSSIVINFLGVAAYLIIYLGAILVGNLLSLWMHRRDYYYSAIGASGGVSGILFASIALYPHLELYLYFIPIPIKGWVFGIIYLAFSVYAMRRSLGNIGHAAHLGGALFGLVMAIVFIPQLLVVNGLYVGIMAIPLLVLAYYVYKEK